MTDRKWVSAGLVFLGSRDIDIACAGNRVGNALDALETRVTATNVTSARCCCIETAHHRLRLTLHEDHPLEALDEPAALYLSVQVCRTDPDTQVKLSAVRCDTILAHLLRVLHKDLVADYIKWIGARALIPHADFVRATAQLDDTTGKRRARRTDRQSSPRSSTSRRRAAARRLPEIEAHSERLDLILQREAPWAQAPSEQDRLRQAYRGIDPEQTRTTGEPSAAQDIREETPVLRLSAWFMSYAVALFCLPVGVALLIINLLRGENLRLASQAAALTGMFLSLQAAGSMAHAANALQSILP